MGGYIFADPSTPLSSPRFAAAKPSSQGRGHGAKRPSQDSGSIPSTPSAKWKHLGGHKFELQPHSTESSPRVSGPRNDHDMQMQIHRSHSNRMEQTDQVAFQNAQRFGARHVDEQQWNRYVVQPEFAQEPRFYQHQQSQQQPQYGQSYPPQSTSFDPNAMQLIAMAQSHRDGPSETVAPQLRQAEEGILPGASQEANISGEKTKDMSRKKSTHLLRGKESIKETSRWVATKRDAVKKHLSPTNLKRIVSRDPSDGPSSPRINEAYYSSPGEIHSPQPQRFGTTLLTQTMNSIDALMNQPVEMNETERIQEERRQALLALEGHPQDAHAEPEFVGRAVTAGPEQQVLRGATDLLLAQGYSFEDVETAEDADNNTPPEDEEESVPRMLDPSLARTPEAQRARSEEDYFGEDWDEPVEAVGTRSAIENDTSILARSPRKEWTGRTAHTERLIAEGELEDLRPHLAHGSESSGSTAVYEDSIFDAYDRGESVDDILGPAPKDSMHVWDVPYGWKREPRCGCSKCTGRPVEDGRLHDLKPRDPAVDYDSREYFDAKLAEFNEQKRKYDCGMAKLEKQRQSRGWNESIDRQSRAGLPGNPVRMFPDLLRINMELDD